MKKIVTNCYKNVLKKRKNSNQMYQNSHVKTPSKQIQILFHDRERKEEINNCHFMWMTNN